METDEFRPLFLLAIVFLFVTGLGFLFKADLTGPDADFSDWLSSTFSSGILDSVSRAVDVAGGIPVLIALSVLMMLFPRTRIIGTVCLVVSVVAWAADSFLLKLIVARPRPYDYFEADVLSHWSQYSYVSGHAVATSAFAAALYAFSKKLSLVFFAYSAFVCFMRVYSLSHYLSDVFMGAVFGICFALILASWAETFSQRFWGRVRPSAGD
jgi:membrane-associated phospholipid phosphatase